MDAIGRRPSRPLPTDPSAGSRGPCQPSVYSLIRRPPAVTVHHLPMLSALFSCGGVMTFRARGPHPMPNHAATLDAESGYHTRCRVSQSWPAPRAVRRQFTVAWLPGFRRLYILVSLDLMWMRPTQCNRLGSRVSAGNVRQCMEL